MNSHDLPSRHWDTLTYRAMAHRTTAHRTQRPDPSGDALFSRLAPANQLRVLYGIEALTDVMARHQHGELNTIDAKDWAYKTEAGDGTDWAKDWMNDWIMRPFLKTPIPGDSGLQGGRFNKDFGVYYCALMRETAVAESVYHHRRFLRNANIASVTQTVRTITARLGPIELLDGTVLKLDHPMYDPDDYAVSQALGATIKAQGASGLSYWSVRARPEFKADDKSESLAALDVPDHQPKLARDQARKQARNDQVQGQTNDPGLCFAVMKPKALSLAKHDQFLRYHFVDGDLQAIEVLPP
ncbi:MAG TPA: RES family NAD+ phosphorylase [Wenzhouxiangella sp.]